jgi:hypothetical protein
VGGAVRRFLVVTAVAGFGLPAGLRAAALLSPSLGLLAWSSLFGVIEVCVPAADLLSPSRREINVFQNWIILFFREK